MSFISVCVISLARTSILCWIKVAEVSILGVLLWLSVLRTQCCHCYGLGCCCGTGGIPGLGNFTHCRHGQKEKQKLGILVCSYLSAFYLVGDVYYGLVIYGLYYVEICSLYTYFVESFFLIINGCWIVSNAFSAFIELNHMLFILHFVNVVYHTNWFADVEPSLHS